MGVAKICALQGQLKMSEPGLIKLMDYAESAASLAGSFADRDRAAHISGVALIVTDPHRQPVFTRLDIVEREGDRLTPFRQERRVRFKGRQNPLGWRI